MDDTTRSDRISQNTSVKSLHIFDSLLSVQSTLLFLIMLYLLLERLNSRQLNLMNGKEKRMAFFVQEDDQKDDSLSLLLWRLLFSHRVNCIDCLFCLFSMNVFCQDLPSVTDLGMTGGLTMVFQVSIHSIYTLNQISLFQYEDHQSKSFHKM